VNTILASFFDNPDNSNISIYFNKITFRNTFVAFLFRLCREPLIHGNYGCMTGNPPSSVMMAADFSYWNKIGIVIGEPNLSLAKIIHMYFAIILRTTLAIPADAGFPVICVIFLLSMARRAWYCTLIQPIQFDRTKKFTSVKWILLPQFKFSKLELFCVIPRSWSGAYIPLLPGIFSVMNF